MDPCSFFCSPFSPPWWLIPHSYWVFPLFGSAHLPGTCLLRRTHGWSQEPWEPNCRPLPLRKRWRGESVLVLRAPITKHLRPGGLKQQKLTLLQLRRPGVWNQSVSRAPWPLWGPGEASVPGFLPACGGWRWPLPWGLIPPVSAFVFSWLSSPFTKSLSF